MKRILIPAAGMHSTESDINKNNKVKVTLGSREVMGTVKFLVSGSEFDMMKEKFSFLSRVLEITVTSAKI